MTRRAKERRRGGRVLKGGLLRNERHGSIVELLALERFVSIDYSKRRKVLIGGYENDFRMIVLVNERLFSSSQTMSLDIQST